MIMLHRLILWFERNWGYVLIGILSLSLAVAIMADFMGLPPSSPRWDLLR